MRTEDRTLVSRVLQGMSDQIAGRASAPTMPSVRAEVGQLETDIDVPDAPNPAFVEDDHDHAAHAPAPRGNSAYAWGGHQNGRIPASALKTIAGGHRLEKTAAEAWTAMVADAAKVGVKLGLTDSYRSFDAQVAVRRKKGDVVATATPGTSVHGWGRAVDANVKDPKALAWLRSNASKYGWVNPAWAQKAGKSYEPWHWEFTGGMK